MSDEIIKLPPTSDNRLAPALTSIGNKTRVKFDGGCLKQDKISFTHGTTASIYIVYEKIFLILIAFMLLYKIVCLEQSN